MTDETQYLQIGGVTHDAFGRREALRVRVGCDTKWEWRALTDDEYQTMLIALNAHRRRLDAVERFSKSDAGARASTIELPFVCPACGQRGLTDGESCLIQSLSPHQADPAA